MSSTVLTVQETVQRATTALRENKVEEAVSLLQIALGEAPNDFAANHLAGVTFLKAGRLPEAIARLLKATQINANHVSARTHLGMAYAAAGKTELARQAFTKALTIDANYALALSGLEKLPPAPAKQKIVAPPVAASAVAPPPAPAMPKPPVPPISKMKDFTQPGAVKAKPAKKESFLQNVDWTDVTLLGVGALFLILGVFLRFGSLMDGMEGMRAYRSFAILLFIIGGSMVKAGMPGREHWRDDF